MADGSAANAAEQTIAAEEGQSPEQLDLKVEEDVQLDCFRRLEEIIKLKATETGDICNSVDTTVIEELIRNGPASKEDKETMLRLLRRVNKADPHKVTIEEWNSFVHSYEMAVLEEGIGAHWWHRMVAMVDLFEVGTWNEFRHYTQTSVFGGVLSIILRVVFVVTIVSTLLDYINDSNTVVKQHWSANDYDQFTPGDFILYFRSASWENVADPTVFQFSMKYYVKEASEDGSYITREEYLELPTQRVSRADNHWWPVAIGADIVAFKPGELVTMKGAYHLRSFKQLEVRLVPCKNSTEENSVVCKPQEVIQSKLQGGSVNIVVRSIDFDNLIHYKSEYWTVLEGSTKQIDLWFDKKSIEVTGKYPTAPADAFVYYIFRGSTEQMALPWSDGTMAVWWFSQGEEKITETHVRESITNVFAVCGGTWATLLSVFGILALWWNTRKLDGVIVSLRRRARYVQDLRIASSDARRLSKQPDLRAPVSLRGVHAASAYGRAGFV